MEYLWCLETCKYIFVVKEAQLNKHNVSNITNIVYSFSTSAKKTDWMSAIKDSNLIAIGTT